MIVSSHKDNPNVSQRAQQLTGGFEAESSSSAAAAAVVDTICSVSGALLGVFDLFLPFFFDFGLEPEVGGPEEDSCC